MPVEETYQSRVTPQATAQQPLATPDVYGAGVARAAGQLGETMHGAQIRAYQIDRKLTADREAADFSHQFALHRQNMDGITRELRANAGPGGAGHVEAVRAANEAARETMLSGITEDSVRRQAAGQWDSYTTQLLEGEGTFEEGQRVAKTVTDRQKSIDVATNRVRTATDPAVYAQELETARRDIEAIHGLDDKTRQQLWDYADQSLAVGFHQHLQDTNPALSRSLLDSGAFNHLDPKVLEQLRSGADVEMRRQAAAAQHAQSMERSALAEDVATVTTKASQGIDVSDEIKPLIDRAGALGDTSTVARLQGIGRDSVFAKAWSPATPGQREDRIGELGRIAADKRTEDQQAELKWLTDHRGSLDSAFNSDPVGWALVNAPAGAKPPAIEDGLPARQRWAAAASRSYGKPIPLFTANEASQLRARAAASPKGQIEVADMLAELGGRDAIRAAQQVAPSDAMLHQLVTLSAEDRGAFQTGADVRKGNRALVDGQAGTDALATFNEQVGAALQLFPPAQRNAAFEVARNLYAADASRKGAGEYRDGDFEKFIARALGGRGLASWRGGRVLLPEGMAETQFYGALNNYKPSTSPNAPAYSDRTPMTAEQLRTYVPVARLDGLYEFRSKDGTQVVKTRDGKTFVLAINRTSP